jgi:hypothetical protein
VAGRGGMERVWAIGAVHFRRDAGAGRRPAHGDLAAKSAGVERLINGKRTYIMHICGVA